MGCFGGDAVYASLAAANWTSKVQFIAPIGEDFPTSNIESLERSTLDGFHLPKRSVPSIRNWVVYEYDGRRTWIERNNPDDFYELSPIPDDILPVHQSAKAFLVLAMDLKAQEELIPYLKECGGIVALDPQEGYIPGNQERVIRMLKDVEIFLPSEEEVFRLLGHRDYDKAIRQFADTGPGIVVIKMGDEGSLIYSRETDTLWKLPILNTKVVDTTGAGDAFSGGFMAKFVLSHDLVQAGLAGTVSASFAIEGYGVAHMLQVTRSMAMARFNKIFEHDNRKT
jgi:sugar/nucleoside kinase (ribokinase family)